ncbi:orotate phosphoribosyltransferase [Zongyangia hominis]|uniref:Orotate phosphoribosyltransferase n=1 Tax=Zongyangia hominis TaxID=2763677 RepID=A0A926EBP3_9FIRM|nr:orotate phosphoribosyltransferase [Zongyangia hominis]MBC8570937.1 orotate phosphoribosyltransferase [Zongyangia hominis]
MELRAIRIKAQNNKKIVIRAVPGHFATSHSHVNYYIDITSPKTQANMAHDVAKELAERCMNKAVDTIVCLDGTEVVGAFLAEELTQSTVVGINIGKDIFVITPEINSSNQMLFRDNTEQMIWQKNVLLLVASVTTGKTINRALDCIKYYGGEVSGICSLFSVIEEIGGIYVESIFGMDDIPDYQVYSNHDCPLCEKRLKIDAIVNSYGFSRL